MGSDEKINLLKEIGDIIVLDDVKGLEKKRRPSDKQD